MILKKSYSFKRKFHFSRLWQIQQRRKFFNVFTIAFGFQESSTVKIHGLRIHAFTTQMITQSFPTKLYQSKRTTIFHCHGLHYMQWPNVFEASVAHVSYDPHRLSFKPNTPHVFTIRYVSQMYLYFCVYHVRAYTVIFHRVS